MRSSEGLAPGDEAAGDVRDDEFGGATDPAPLALEFLTAMAHSPIPGGGSSQSIGEPGNSQDDGQQPGRNAPVCRILRRWGRQNSAKIRPTRSGKLLRESPLICSEVHWMSQLYVVVLAIIVAALLAVAIYRATRVKTKADYLVAGRSLPALVLVLTLLTSWIGAGSLFAGAENAYKNGFAALWQPAGGWFGLLLIYFIAPRARKFAQITLPDLLEARYNQTARVLGTFAILFAYIGITSYQFKGGGDVLHLIFPDEVTPELGTFIIAAFVILTTALAGMSSVA